MTILDQATQNAYSDLLAASLNPAFDGKGISFTRKIVSGKTYIYVSTKVGQTPIQKYIGPDTPETQALVAREKQLWQGNQQERATRARLVNMILVGGIAGPTPQEGKVLRILERAGIFLAGGILVGTPAFRCMGAMLGVSWHGQFATRDVDIAARPNLPVAIGQQTIELKSVLEDSGMGFVEIPALSPKQPSTSFKMRGGEFRVELLTPATGKADKGPIEIPFLNARAEPLRYLEYLLDETQPAVVPFDIGVLVNVPDPARFALHKLVISQRRPTAFAAKAAKDIDQAKQLLEALIEARPGALIVAKEAAEEMGKKFNQQLKQGFNKLPAALKRSVLEWITIK